MASASPERRAAIRSWSFAAGRDAAGEDLAALAAQAQGVFATRSELCAWLACAYSQRAHGGEGRPRAVCDEVSAAACAVRFYGSCPGSCTPRQFEKIVVGLTTPQLEALLALRRP